MIVEGKQFVDTNIIVYAHDFTAGEKHTRAKALLLDLWSNQMGCLSVQVLQEFYVTVTQKIKKPLSSLQANDIITSLCAWKVYSPSASDVISAIQLHQKQQISFWDAMILLSAAKMGCGTLWSEDLNAQKYNSVQVINPFRIDESQ
jgi:predicted nucleic acid-binding protein